MDYRKISSFPNMKDKNREDFLKKMELSVRRRLELRKKDEVVFDLKW